jgi:2-isopropylmalate synthase
MVSQMSGMMVQRNKAIVGANAFAHEAGIHQDGILKERTTYEIMKPEDVGISGSELVLGKHSGRHALIAHLARMGFDLSEEQKDAVYNSFKDLADKKKMIYDDDLIAIMGAQMSQTPTIFTLEYLQVSTGTSTVPTATVKLKKEGKVFRDSACGDGPVDATLKTIDRITGRPGDLRDYSIQAVTRGEDAVGEVSMTVAFGKDYVSAKAASTDIVEASAKAYLNALNSHLFTRSAGKPEKPGARRDAGRQP